MPDMFTLLQVFTLHSKIQLTSQKNSYSLLVCEFNHFNNYFFVSPRLHSTYYLKG